MLPTSDIFPTFMDFPDRGALNQRFERLDYGSFYSIMILGCIFIAMVWMIFLYFVYLVLRLFRLRFRWPQRMIKYLHKMLFWKQWLVFAYATFIEIVICILLQLHIVETDWLETRWVLFSFLVTIALIIILIYLLVATFCIVWPEHYKWGKTKKMKKKYDILLEPIQKSSGTWAMLFHVCYYAQRIVLALVTIYWNS